ncbi:solute carrier family 23 protein [Lysinibacillus piscis]|uniref:Uracil transporter n=1 Tax=Lysinibacillus piscis TaxID=2518931 RepID=A0ABQ5NGX9_9BACI|nr:solute carrier family 23 protein [Lysinibacillus sp. KH24]GLC87533.1 uracil transporter [Lysinibacillus sp. KH24]
MSKAILDVQDKPTPIQLVTLSFQHMFAMFGSTILVPTLVGLSPAIALLTSGIATLCFLLITKFQVPAYLGSSFAFITPILLAAGGLNENGASVHPGNAMIGAMAVGITYGLVSLVIWKSGYQWIMKILPPIVVGPVTMVIGLGLSGTAVNMAMNVDGKYSMLHFSAALVTLFTAIIFTIFFKGILSTMPILMGLIVGYLYSMMIGIVDYAPIAKASFFAKPDFLIPGVHYDFEITTKILLIMVPIVIVTISEHIGHQLVLGKVVNRDYIKEPGLHRSLLGDGLGTLISACIGGPPKTTYGENIGVLAITRIYSIYVIAGAAVLAIVLAFFGKAMAVIATIPTAVLGGVSILLFGIIAASGLRMLVDQHIDFGNSRNLVIASVILVIGIGGAKIVITEALSLEGMALAAIIGVVLNLVLPGRKEAEIPVKSK